MEGRTEEEDRLARSASVEDSRGRSGSAGGAAPVSAQDERESNEALRESLSKEPLMTTSGGNASSAGTGGSNGGKPLYTSVSLSPAVVRALSDRSYEKRKAGAVEIEKVVREKASAPGGGAEYVVTLINILTMDYACSMNSNQRKGGLIGLAAVALGLGPANTPKFLQYLLPPVLKCFDDPEGRVRYYACEALYNIAKVARRHVLAYFNALFDGLFRLFTDLDVDVKNGAQLLDRLMKEIVTENCDTFQIEMFVPLLEKHLVKSNPYTRQFLIGWILALDAVPEIDFLEHLPRVLEGIFNMLSDQKREIRQQADMALGRFLSAIQATKRDTYEQENLTAITQILISQSSSSQKFNRLTAVSWIHEFLIIFESKLAPVYAGVVGALLNCISDSENDIKSVAERALSKMLELVQSSKKEELNLRPLIAVVTEKLSIDTGSNNSPMSRQSGTKAVASDGRTSASTATKPEDSVPIPTRMAALKWISMLLDKFPNEMKTYLYQLTPAMLQTLSDPSDELVVQDLEVLARIARNTSRMEQVVGQVIRVFREDRGLFDSRGSFVIRKLCVLLSPGTVYMILAREVDKESDTEFAHLMVQNLNLILLTAPELGRFRNRLRQSWCNACGIDSSPDDDEKKEEVFVTLYKTWCFDPVATLSLCLMAESYDLASMLVTKLADANITVGFLIEIDKLVQLLESPAFLSLRLELVKSGSAFRPALLRALYGLLMILPQSTAYTTLSNRLNAASAMHLAFSANARPFGADIADAADVTVASTTTKRKLFGKSTSDTPPPPPNGATQEKQDIARKKFETSLLNHFSDVQSKIVQRVEDNIHSKSLFQRENQN